MLTKAGELDESMAEVCQLMDQLKTKHSLSQKYYHVYANLLKCEIQQGMPESSLTDCLVDLDALRVEIEATHSLSLQQRYHGLLAKQLLMISSKVEEYDEQFMKELLGADGKVRSFECLNGCLVVGGLEASQHHSDEFLLFQKAFTRGAIANLEKSLVLATQLNEIDEIQETSYLLALTYEQSLLILSNGVDQHDQILSSALEDKSPLDDLNSIKKRRDEVAEVWMNASQTSSSYSSSSTTSLSESQKNYGTAVHISTCLQSNMQQTATVY